MPTDFFRSSKKEVNASESKIFHENKLTSYIGKNAYSEKKIRKRKFSVMFRFSACVLLNDSPFWQGFVDGTKIMSPGLHPAWAWTVDGQVTTLLNIIFGFYYRVPSGINTSTNAGKQIGSASQS